MHGGRDGKWSIYIQYKNLPTLRSVSDVSDKNGTAKLKKMTIFDRKWNFWNLMAKFDK